MVKDSTPVSSTPSERQNEERHTKGENALGRLVHGRQEHQFYSGAEQQLYEKIYKCVRCSHLRFKVGVDVKISPKQSYIC